jgi:uncharacterized protein (TIGR02217 family)
MFHEIRFPTAIALAATGGPERRTRIVTLTSGFEERNTPWAQSRRRFEAGYGVKTLDDLHEVIAFFEARRGRLHGFRWQDAADHKSCAPSEAPSATDQPLGTGDGTRTTFQLSKTYSSGGHAYIREITKPVAGTVTVALDGAPIAATTDIATGKVTFAAPPPQGATLTAGFEFDTPVRFDTDRLDINLTGFEAGEIPAIPVIEIKL